MQENKNQTQNTESLSPTIGDKEKNLRDTVDFIDSTLNQHKDGDFDETNLRAAVEYLERRFGQQGSENLEPVIMRGTPPPAGRPSPEAQFRH